MSGIIHSLYKVDNIGNRFKLLINVKEILANVWDEWHMRDSAISGFKMVYSSSKRKLKDIYITECNVIYRIMKTQFCFENYLITLPSKFRKRLIQIRTRNHRLPIETGRSQNVRRDERLCTLCN